MVLVLQGTGSLWLDGHIVQVGPGDCVGFPAGTGIAHNFINDSNADGGAGHELWLFIVGENKRHVDKVCLSTATCCRADCCWLQVIYPVNPERQANFSRWWHGKCSTLFSTSLAYMLSVWIRLSSPCARYVQTLLLVLHYSLLSGPHNGRPQVPRK